MNRLILIFCILFSSTVFASIEGQGRISKVVDGDTFDIQVNDFSKLQSLYKNNMVGKKFINVNKQTFRVRLGNTNTEESKHTDQSKNTSFGSETSSVVKNKFSNVNVKFICYKKGYYERAICDLYTKEGNLAGWLISNNYSPYVTKFGKHPTLHNEYKGYSTSTASTNSLKFDSENLNYNNLSNLKKPSKKKMAKAVYNYFTKHKGDRGIKRNTKQIEKMTPQTILQGLAELKRDKENPQFNVSNEQKAQLSWLNNLKNN
jgi:endonuclease YncB( thermonuclease family)